MATPEHICPRCTYDLTGIIDSWHDACPLTGTCSECGLSFTWHDVLRGPLSYPRWSFEHALPSRRIPAFFSTLSRTLLPTHLWRGLRLEMHIVPSRLIAFILLSTLTLKLLGVLIFGIPRLLDILSRARGWGRTPDIPSILIALFWPYSEYGIWRQGSVISPWPLVAILTTITLPFTFFLILISLRRAKVSPRHLARVQAYSLAILVWTVGMWTLLHTIHQLLNRHAWQFLDALGLTAWDAVDMKLGIVSLLWTALVLLRFWTVATRDYLRMENPFTLALAMTAIASLASLLAVVFFNGHALFR